MREHLVIVAYRNHETKFHDRKTYVAVLSEQQHSELLAFLAEKFRDDSYDQTYFASTWTAFHNPGLPRLSYLELMDCLVRDWHGVYARRGESLLFA
jgi:hypothetical protein